ncbi:DNA repair protein rad2 [Polyrhizophydium stewartii]|uniref:DNA repair protein rad2 n=1 Tax=Polyrhizophydium stewartii TaxID=2732419 RepID=A0ABR4NA50_9FUNG
MGVKGLWSLVERSGRPVSLESLGGRRVAVDASIWLHQFIKAMRDRQGNLLHGAHLVGFFRRICKLLFYGVRPVFVFDGQTPALKRQTIVASEQNHRKTAERLLSRQLMRRAVAETAAAAKRSARKAGTEHGGADDGDTDAGADGDAGPRPAAPAAALARGAKRLRDEFELPAESGTPFAGAQTDQRLATDEELRAFIAEHRSDIDLSQVNIDSAEFQHLPIEMQHEIIIELKNKARAPSRARVDQMLQASHTASDFSKQQIKNLVHRNTLTERITHFAQNAGVVKNPVANRFGTWKRKQVINRRVAGVRGRNFVLVKNEDPSASGGRALVGGWSMTTQSSEKRLVDGIAGMDGFAKPGPRPRSTLVRIVDSDDDADDFVDVAPRPASPGAGGDQSLIMDEGAYVGDDVPLEELLAKIDKLEGDRGDPPAAPKDSNKQGALTSPVTAKRHPAIITELGDDTPVTESPARVVRALPVVKTPQTSTARDEITEFDPESDDDFVTLLPPSKSVQRPAAAKTPTPLQSRSSAKSSTTPAPKRVLPSSFFRSPGARAPLKGKPIKSAVFDPQPVQKPLPIAPKSKQLRGKTTIIDLGDVVGDNESVQEIMERFREAELAKPLKPLSADTFAAEKSALARPATTPETAIVIEPGRPEGEDAQMFADDSETVEEVMARFQRLEESQRGGSSAPALLAADADTWSDTDADADRRNENLPDARTAVRSFSAACAARKAMQAKQAGAGKTNGTKHPQTNGSNAEISSRGRLIGPLPRDHHAAPPSSPIDVDTGISVLEDSMGFDDDAFLACAASISPPLDALGDLSDEHQHWFSPATLRLSLAEIDAHMARVSKLRGKSVLGSERDLAFGFLERFLFHVHLRRSQHEEAAPHEQRTDTGAANGHGVRSVTDVLDDAGEFPRDSMDAKWEQDHANDAEYLRQAEADADASYGSTPMRSGGARLTAATPPDSDRTVSPVRSTSVTQSPATGTGSTAVASRPASRMSGQRTGISAFIGFEDDEDDIEIEPATTAAAADAAQDTEMHDVDSPADQHLPKQARPKSSALARDRSDTDDDEMEWREIVVDTPAREPVPARRAEAGMEDHSDSDDAIEWVDAGQPPETTDQIVVDVHHDDMEPESETEAELHKVQEEIKEIEAEELRGDTAIDVPTELDEELRDFQEFCASVSDKPLDQVAAQIGREVSELEQQQRREQRDASDITGAMIAETQELLRLFGLPYIVAPTEAESQCAFLLDRGLVDAVVTDDSDILLFGGRCVLRNMFNQAKFVEQYGVDQIASGLQLTRRRLIQLAYLLGSDYTPGLTGVGPVTALEILSEWCGDSEGLQGLVAFKQWASLVARGVTDPEESPGKKKLRKLAAKLDIPDSFPDPRVLDAYLQPVVDESTAPFEWGRPDVEGIREVMQDKPRLTPEGVNQVLIPVIREMNRRQLQAAEAGQNQQTLERFFGGPVISSSVAGSKHKSSRVQSALDGLSGKAKPGAASRGRGGKRLGARQSATTPGRSASRR